MGNSMNHLKIKELHDFRDDFALKCDWHWFHRQTFTRGVNFETDLANNILPGVRQH